LVYSLAIGFLLASPGGQTWLLPGCGLPLPLKHPPLKALAPVLIDGITVSPITRIVMTITGIIMVTDSTGFGPMERYVWAQNLCR
jgi:hypothetical protein